MIIQAWMNRPLFKTCDFFDGSSSKPHATMVTPRDDETAVDLDPGKPKNQASIRNASKIRVSNHGIMMNWLLVGCFAMLSFGSYGLFSKLSAFEAPTISNLVIYATAVICGIVLLAATETGVMFSKESFLSGISSNVRNPEDKIVRIGESHEMVSLGWGNMTPWKCPRDTSEEELEQKIESHVKSVEEMQNCIFNFHVPPIDSTIDSAPRLGSSVYPPKPIIQGGQPVMFGAGSVAVRRSIKKYQPLIGLHGHIHESRGVFEIGKTPCFNPGSEYSEGILKGIIVSLKDERVTDYQFTSG